MQKILEDMFMLFDNYQDDLTPFSISIGYNADERDMKFQVDLIRNFVKGKIEKTKNEESLKFINEFVSFLENHIIKLLLNIKKDMDVYNCLLSNCKPGIFDKEEINPFLMFYTFYNLPRKIKYQIISQNKYTKFWEEFGYILRSREYTISISKYINNKNKDTRGKVQPIKEFADMPNLKWDEIEIAFVRKGFHVTISARDKRLLYKFDTLGFGKKKNGKSIPNILWNLLFQFSQHPEGITWKTNITPKEKKNIKKTISRLGKHLMILLNIDSKPFLDYRLNNSYKPEFKLRDLTFKY